MKGDDMSKKLLIVTILFAMGAGMLLSGRSRAAVEVTSGPDNGIVVTLTETDRSALALGDSLRKSRNFDEAIGNYQQVTNDNDVEKIVRAEAGHNIGLCLIEMGRYDEAESLYDNTITDDNADAKSKAYARYCIAWINIQRKNYDAALNALQSTLSDDLCNDNEIKAHSMFMMGRIYKNHLHNSNEAVRIFKDVAAKYPDTEICRHPFIAKIDEFVK